MMERTGWTDAALQDWRRTRRPEALGELLKSQRNRAYAIALRITASSADAEDAVQDAFIKLLSRTHGLDDADAFELTVYRAVVQCALDGRRATQRRQAREDVARASQAGSGDAIVPGPEDQTAEQSQEQAEAQMLLRQSVAKLSDDERAPVVLCYYQGLSVVQTAKTLKLPRETVRARLNRALGRLRQTLRKNNREMSAAVLLALLWQDGNVAAPASLCAALDRALPGKACSAIAAPSHAGPVQLMAGTSVAGVGATTLLVTVTSVVLLSVGVFWFAHTTPVETRSAAIAVTDASPPQAGDASRNQRGSAEVHKEEVPVKWKIGAIVLAAGMMLPAAVQATEPNAQVADAIAQIAARRAEKDAANAAAIKARANAEGRENGWNPTTGGGGPGGAVRPRK
jgi:RNA polymerase sigma-70 factor (ECF subfamily)